MTKKKLPQTLDECNAEIAKAKQQPKSPVLAKLFFKYMDIQRERSRKYSQSWQRQHTADELKAISQAVNLLMEKEIFDLDGLDAALSSVSKKTDGVRAGMVVREKRMKQIQKLIENAQTYQRYKR